MEHNYKSFGFQSTIYMKRVLGPDWDKKISQGILNQAAPSSTAAFGPGSYPLPITPGNMGSIIIDFNIQYAQSKESCQYIYHILSIL